MGDPPRHSESRVVSGFANHGSRSCRQCRRRVLAVSRQSEKFPIGQSRKFLLTAKHWKGGTNRDKPGGTRLAGVAKESAGRSRHAAAGRRKDGRQRSVGAKAAGAHEDRWRRRCRARSAGANFEPADRREDAGACHQVAEAAGVARFRADVRQRAVSQTARHSHQQRDVTRLDGVSRIMEGAVAQTRRDAFLAAATERLRRNWCNGTPRHTIGWRAEARRYVTWCG